MCMKSKKAKGRRPVDVLLLQYLQYGADIILSIITCVLVWSCTRHTQTSVLVESTQQGDSNLDDDTEILLSMTKFFISNFKT